MRTSSSAIAWRESSAGPVRAWIIVGAIWAAYVINYVDRQVAFSLFPVLQSELGFSNAQLGLVGTVFLWVYSLCCPLVGRLADILRKEYLLAGSVCLWSVAVAGTGFSATVGQFLLWRVVLGVTESLFVPAALSSIAAVHPGPTRSRALSLYASGQMAGIVGGGWYGGWIAGAWDWRRGYLLLALIGLAFAPILWLLLGRLPRSERAPGSRSTTRDIFTARCYWALAGAFFMFCVLLWMLYAWLPTFLYEHYRLPLADSGLLATAYLQAGTVAGLFAGGTLADSLVRRIPATRLYIAGAGLLLAAPFAYLTFSGASLGVFKISAMAFGLFSGLMISNIFASAYDVMAARNYGLGAGVLNMIGGLSGGAAMFLAGRWKDSLGIGGMMQWAALAAAASSIVLLMVAATRFRSDRQRAGLLLIPARESV